MIFGELLGCRVPSGSACSLPAMPASSKASRVEQNLLYRSQAPSHVYSLLGLEEKTVLSKKEKMKLRKERWLQKIESVKMAKQKQKAEAKRRATPVVGDMQPLMEALPELSDLTTSGRGRKPLKRYVLFRGGLCGSLTWAHVTYIASELLTQNQPPLVLAWRNYRLFFPLLASGFVDVCIEVFEIIRGSFYRI
uniref:Uncharacterized protein n=1 Tax=Corvus moneduloides TaxID=1196302 RepID=A0A8U7NE90_CORMO